jgi:hypothetical protein
MSDGKNSPVSLERVDHVSTKTKELGDEEEVSDFERTKYLVSNYAHDVGIKVFVFYAFLSSSLMSLFAGVVHPRRSHPISFHIQASIRWKNS